MSIYTMYKIRYMRKAACRIANLVGFNLYPNVTLSMLQEGKNGSVFILDE